ncbi:MAG TPA: hypothetical protein VJZ78_03525 [Anaerolineales bacterium]|nr:hypothetical protein [Anaerolineales bacterium]
MNGVVAFTIIKDKAFARSKSFAVKWRSVELEEIQLSMGVRSCLPPCARPSVSNANRWAVPRTIKG